MNKIIFFSFISSTLFASNNFLGVFTTSLYPVDGCKIVKAYNKLYVNEKIGNFNQYTKLEKNYISEISQFPLRKEMIIDAKKMGYNAVIGYKYYVEGGYDGFNGSNINGSIGIGVYRAGVMGNFILVECNNSK